MLSIKKLEKCPCFSSENIRGRPCGQKRIYQSQTNHIELH